MEASLYQQIATVASEEMLQYLCPDHGQVPGQYYDDETDFHYNWFRYYDPAIGAYRRPDPLGLAAGVNLYAYTAGNPVNFIDPYGLNTMNSPAGVELMAFFNTFNRINSAVQGFKTVKEAMDFFLDPCKSDEEKRAMLSKMAGSAILEIVLGKLAGKALDFAGDAFKKAMGKKSKTPGSCFVAGTLIQTEFGL